MPGGKSTLQVELGITANTQQAKAALSDLAQSLNRMTAGNLNQEILGSVASIKNATLAAQELQSHLQSAINVNTGKLDLGIFSRKLQETGHDLDYFYNTLTASGSTGSEVFLNLSRSIALAEAPVTSVNKKLADMGTTLKNTIKWQLSSSIIHGFVGAIEQAYGYAKNLDKSLNDIRIVTGQSAEQMANFAERANKAARELSTTTNEYAQASLIYYQQGLSDEEVEGRTNTTIKLANVSRQTAEETSQQLTAVWNNFYDGSKSLEYYADVMTALGAATASSTDEISTGLQKFAATANTVGLSYEYATAALATVTATTRESAQTVGTAFRTLFSRLEGLKLGETLEDGTDLNKYSAALASVGVNIKDVNGDMRSMDNILDDLGDKWQTLAQDQKVALAETVGGARQYTQLMALLDNWDFFEENLKTANSATGTLQEQANIYEQSWEAARDRVTAALEEIYKKLVDEKFFVKLADFSTKMLDVLNYLTDGFGGLKGILLAISSIFLNVYAKEMPVVFEKLGTTLFNITNKSREQTVAMQQQNEKYLEAFVQNTFDPVAKAKAQGLLEASQLNTQLIRDETKLSSIEKERLKIQINQKLQQAEFNGLIAKQIQEEEQQLRQQKQIAQDVIDQKKTQLDIKNSILADEYYSATSTTNRIDTFKSFGNAKSLTFGPSAADNDYQNYQNYRQQINNLIDQITDDGFGGEEIVKALIKFRNTIEGATDTSAIQTVVDDFSQKFPELLDKLKQKIAEELKAFNNPELLNNIESMGKRKGQLADISARVEAANFSGKETAQTRQDLLNAASDALNMAEGTEWKPAIDASNDLQKLIVGFKNGAVSAFDFGQAIHILGAELSSAENSKFDDEIKNMGAVSDDTKVKLRNLLDVTEQVTQTHLAQDRMPNGNDNVLNPESKYDWTQTASQAASAVTMYASAMSSLNNTIKTFSSEGFVKGLSSIVPTATSGAMAIGSLQKAIEALGISASVANPILLILTATIGAIQVISAVSEKHKQDLIESANAARKTANETYELVEANQKLYASYQDNLAIFRQTGDITQELIASAKEVADAYDIEGASVLILGKQYEALNTAIQKARVEENEQYIKSQQAAQKLTGQELGQQFADSRGKFKNDRYYSVNFANDYGNVLSELSIFDNNDLAFNVDITNADEVIEFYNQLTEIRDQLVTDNKTDSDAFKQINELLKSSSDLYSEYETLALNGADSFIQNLVAAQGQADFNNVKAFKEDYEKIKRELLTNYNADENSVFGKKLIKELDSQLKKVNADYERLLNESKAFDEAGLTEKQQTLYESLSEDDKVIFWRIEIDEDTTNDKIRASIEKLKSTYENEKILLSIDVVDSLKSSIKKGDWETVKKTYEEQGFDKILPFKDFMRKSAAEMGKWLDAQFNYSKLLDVDSVAKDYDAATQELERQKKELEQQAAEIEKRYDGQYTTADINQALKIKQFDASETNAFQSVFGENFSDKNISDSEQFEELINELLKILDQTGYFNDKNLSDPERYTEAKNLLTKIKTDRSDPYLLEAMEEIFDLISPSELQDDASKDDLNQLLEINNKINILQAEIDQNNLNKENGADINWRKAFDARAEQLDLDPDEVLDYTDVLKEMAEASGDVSDEVLNNSDALAEFALNVKQAQKGLDALVKGFADWKEAIEGDDTGAAAEAMVELKNALADTLGISDELNEEGKTLGQHFGDYLKENMDVVEKAAQKDQDAIFELQRVAAEDLYLQLDTTATQESLANLEYTFPAMFENIQTWLANNQLEIGPVKNQQAIDSLRQFIDNLGLSAKQAQAILSTMGFQAKIKTESHKIRITEGFEVSPGVWTGPVDTYVTRPIISWESLKYTGGGGSSVPYTSTKPYTPKSSKGGGGGGSKQKDKEKKDVTDETERYHVLNAQMEDMKNVLDELSDAKDRAFGKSRLAVMDQEIDKTKQQIELQKEYIQQIEDYLRTDKSAIAAYGAEFDAAGNIVNYDALVAQEVAKYNAAVDKYNAGKIDDDSLETYEKAYKEFQDLLKQYEESNDLYQEQARELINLQHELFDKMLEKIQYGVEYKISLSDDSLEYLDYLLGRIDDDAYDAAQAIALLGEKTAEAVAQQEAYQQGLNDILALHLDEQEIAAFNSGDMSVLEGKDFTDNEIQAIREYKSALLEVNEQLEEIRDTIYEKVLNAFSEMSDELDEQIDKFDYYDSLLEHYQNIIDLTGEKVLGISEELASMLDDARIENATNRVAATKSKLNAINSSLLEAEDALERARQEGSEEDVKKWEEIIEEMTATQEDALDNYLQAWEDALEAINDKFDKQMEESIEKFKKALVPDDQVRSLSELYDRQKEIQDQFLPEYQKIYELSKLNRDINQKLADTDNIRAKEMLLELQKEINEYAEDGVEMSQYDLEYLQKKYDLKLAEIALEEAQNAKNQVKLTRDSEGNYGYVYTANQDNIDKAQQDYEDKLYQLQKLNTDYVEEMEKLFIQTQEDMAEAIANIRREDYESQEEYEAAIAAEAAYWQQRLDYISNEMDKALGHNKDLYDQDWQNYSNATDYKIAADERFLDSFEETILAQETGLTTIEELTNAVADATNTLMDELTSLYATWWEQVQEVYAAAEVPVDEYANYVGEKMDEISEKSTETAENTDEMANQMVEDFQEVANAASEWAATYGKALDEIIKKNEEMVKSFNQLIKELKEVEAELSEYANIKADTSKPPATGSDSKGSGGSGSGSGSGGSSNTSPKTESSSYIKVIANGYAETALSSSNNLLNAIDAAGGSSSIRAEAKKLNSSYFSKIKESEKKQKINEIINRLRNADSYSYAQMEGHGFKIYRRGGLNTYTGPAWLDGTPSDPEMVLNATDTRNMLDIISMVRSIVQMVDTNVSTFTRDINLTTSRISSGGLAQDVTIHAEFPNAVNHSEIEQAFDNLINRASQYANRK